MAHIHDRGTSPYKLWLDIVRFLGFHLRREDVVFPSLRMGKKDQDHGDCALSSSLNTAQTILTSMHEEDHS